MTWMGWACGTYERQETGFWWGNEGKKPVGRCRHRWEDNIKIDVKEMGWRVAMD